MFMYKNVLHYMFAIVKFTNIKVILHFLYTKYSLYIPKSCIHNPRNDKFKSYNFRV